MIHTTLSCNVASSTCAQDTLYTGEIISGKCDDVCHIVRHNDNSNEIHRPRRLSQRELIDGLRHRLISSLALFAMCWPSRRSCWRGRYLRSVSDTNQTLPPIHYSRNHRDKNQRELFLIYFPQSDFLLSDPHGKKVA